jgi:DNA-directed RNA polymerase subunit RPC12/RpoP
MCNTKVTSFTTLVEPVLTCPHCGERLQVDKKINKWLHWVIFKWGYSRAVPYHKILHLACGTCKKEFDIHTVDEPVFIR